MKNAFLLLFTFLITNAAFSQVSDDDLRIYLKFDNTLTDYSGNDYDGLPISSISYLEGVKCLAVKISDNVQNAIKLDHRVMNGLNDFTIMFFGKIYGLNNSNNLLSGANSSSDNEFMLQYNAVGTYGVNGWHLRIDNTNHSFQSDTTMNDLDWHHVAVIREGNQARLYIDKVKVGDDITVDPEVISIDFNGLIIGQDQDCVGGCFGSGQNWNGLIDEMRVYEKALDLEEIEDIVDEVVCTVTYYDSIAVTDTLIIDVDLTTTGINGSLINTIKVYPNPTSDVIQINTGENFESINNYTIKIINSSSQTVFENIINQQSFSIDVSEFGATGLYFIQIIDDQQQLVDIRKIILQ